MCYILHSYITLLLIIAKIKGDIYFYRSEMQIALQCTQFLRIRESSSVIDGFMIDPVLCAPRVN